MQYFKQSEGTAARRRFFIHLVDATDGITVETGVTGTPQISKNGGAFTNTTNTLTEVANGLYYVDLTATELDTLGKVVVRFKTAATAEFQDIGLVAAVDLFATSNPATIPTGGITASSFAAGAIDAAAIATDAIGAAELAADAINEIADGILKRGISTAEGTADARSLLWAVAKLVNKIDISGATLTIRKTDDAAALFTQAVTTSAGANPIVGLDTA